MSQTQPSRESLRLRQVKIFLIHSQKPVEITLLHNILINQLQMPDSLAGEKVCGCASNASGADDRNSGGLQFLETVNPDSMDCCLSGEIIRHLHVQDVAICLFRA